MPAEPIGSRSHRRWFERSSTNCRIQLRRPQRLRHYAFAGAPRRPPCSGAGQRVSARGWPPSAGGVIWRWRKSGATFCQARPRCRPGSCRGRPVADPGLAGLGQVRRGIACGSGGFRHVGGDGVAAPSPPRTAAAAAMVNREPAMHDALNEEVVTPAVGRAFCPGRT